jgi:lambda family phage portal protein
VAKISVKYAEPTLLDRLALSVSPTWGMQRLRARTAAETALGYMDVKRREHGRAREDEEWARNGSQTGDATAKLRNAKLLDAARKLAAVNPFARRAVSLYEAFMGGMTPRPVLEEGQEAQADRITALWKDWADWADADGITDFEGLLNQMIRCLVIDGEVLIHKVVPPPSAIRKPIGTATRGVPLPLQIRVMSIDYLDAGLNNIPETGNVVSGGIEYAPDGRRVAYHLRRYHPAGRQTTTAQDSIRIPAEDILHVFDRVQPHQERGVTWFEAVIRRLADLDEYQEAEIVKKKIEACFVMFVSSPESADPLTGETTEEDNSRIETVRPGMTVYGKQGETVSFGQPRVSGGYAEFVRVNLHAIAVALDLTYELLTGDLGQVNFSSGRMGLIPFRRRVERAQKNILVPQALVEIWDWFIGIAQVANKAPGDTDIPVIWSPRRWESIQPLEDAQEENARMRNGTISWRQAVANRGYDPKVLLKEITEDREAFDKAGIILDSDPSKTTQSGQLQRDPEAEIEAQAEADVKVQKAAPKPPPPAPGGAPSAAGAPKPPAAAKPAGAPPPRRNLEESDHA